MENKDRTKVKKISEKLSERIDALEISLLMLLNNLSLVKTFKVGEKEFNVIGKIPEKTIKMIESIIVKNKNF